MTTSVSDKLAKLHSQFAKQLPERLSGIRANFDALRSVWEISSAEQLHHSLHNLTGSASTFNMPLVSNAARQLEYQISDLIKSGIPPTKNDWQPISYGLDQLDELLNIEVNTDAKYLKAPPSSLSKDYSPLIDLIEDDYAQAECLGQALQDEGYRVRVFTDPDELRTYYAVTNNVRPDAVIMDMVFPEGNIGAKLIEEHGLGRDTGIPVVVTSSCDDLVTRLAAFRAGANRYLTKPLDTTQLIGFLNNATGRQPQQPYRVLLVDDEPLFLEATAAILQDAGMVVQTSTDVLHILDEVDEFTPDVMVIDVYMPEVTGPELAAVLRERDEQMYMPILFLSAEKDISQQLLALNFGGDDFLEKTLSPDHLIAAVTARAQRARQNNDTQQRLKTTLYEREREHLALNEHAIVSIADRGGNITYINDLFCKISGYSQLELLGKNHRVVKSDTHPPEFYVELWKTISNGETWQGEVCNRRKDGTLYWVESTITPFMDSYGTSYQYVSIRTDITHMKMAEKALAIQKERLRRGQLYANIGTWEWKIQSGELFWSERIGPLFGYPAGDLEISFDSFISWVHEDDRQIVTDALKACIEDDEPYEVEHRVVWPDGTIRWLLERGATVRDDEGNPVQMLGVVQDIDERKRAEFALDNARIEAERANAAKSDFLSNMSHELRTPMNAILGFGQIMEYDDSLNDEQTESVHEILNAGHHLLELINEVLDLAKIESGRIDLSIEPVEVCSVIDECFMLIKPLADKRNILISHSGLKGLDVKADRIRFKQALLNLLSNAIKYNRESGSVKIEVQAAESGQLRICVSDTGYGIPDDKIDELFQSFNRLDAENSGIEGTGIGLSITRRIIEMMDGNVGVESKPGVGSIFWLELPTESMEEVSQSNKKNTTSSTPHSLEDEQVLRTVIYIEDNPANLKLVTHILSQRSHIKLLTAHTPELGIELALAHKPELILLDMDMFGINGYHVFDAIKSNESLNTIPVFAITAKTIPSDIRRGKESGFAEYLTKPLNIANFLKTIDHYLVDNTNDKT